MSFFSELRRRNVFRVAAAYLVISWLLLQVADVLFEALVVPDWATKLLIAFLALGFLPALVFSWVYELTPEGVRRESDVPKRASVTHETGRKLDTITLGALVLVVGLFLADRFFGIGAPPAEGTDPHAGAETGNPSVAVLPFVNMSGNPDNEYFSDGLTETLLHMLAQVPDLKVAARTSSFAFKGRDVDVREIASQLGVKTVLEGSVQRSGERVRVTAQLVDSSDGTHLWSENFDRTLDDIFAIQDEIATEVVNALSEALLIEKPGAIVSVATEDLGAYDLYLKGLTERAKFSYGSLAEAEGLFKEALARDPDFHDAKLELAKTYLNMVSTGSIGDEEGLDRADALAGQVLRDRAGDVTAEGLQLIVEGQRAIRRGDFPAFLGMTDTLKELVAKAPNDPMFRRQLAFQLSARGDIEGAIGVTRGTLEIDPLNTQAHQQLADLHAGDDRFEAAEATLHRARELAPDNPNVYGRLAEVTRAQGRLDEGIRWYIRASEVDPKDHELPSEIAQWLYFIGLTDEGDEFRKRAEAIAPAEGLVKSLQPLSAWSAGDEDRALELARGLIEKDIDNRQEGWENTLRLYLNLMSDDGRYREAAEFVETQYPDTLDYDQAPQSIKSLVARWALLPTLSMLSEDDADIIARTNALYDFMDQSGFDWRNEPGIVMWEAYFSGDRERAREMTLQKLEEGLTRNLKWRLDLTHPAMADLIADPAIRSKLDEFQREEIRLRDEVREMLTQRDKRT